MEARVEGLLNGLMIYWKEIPEAALYKVRLFIKDQHLSETYENGRKRIVEGKSEFIEIAVVEEPRTIRYHTFTGLPSISRRIVANGQFPVQTEDTGRSYYAKVEAENRAGEKIGESDMLPGTLDRLTGDSLIRHY